MPHLAELLARDSHPLGIGPTIMLAAQSHCVAQSLDRNKAITSRFFVGYLLGFLDPMRLLDKDGAEAFAQHLFEAMYGNDSGAVHLERAEEYDRLDDPQTAEGYRHGEIDGLVYVNALLGHSSNGYRLEMLKQAFERDLVDVGVSVTN